MDVSPHYTCLHTCGALRGSNNLQIMHTSNGSIRCPPSQSKPLPDHKQKTHDFIKRSPHRHKNRKTHNWKHDQRPETGRAKNTNTPEQLHEKLKLHI